MQINHCKDSWLWIPGLRLSAHPGTTWMGSRPVSQPRHSRARNGVRQKTNFMSRRSPDEPTPRANAPDDRLRDIRVISRNPHVAGAHVGYLLARNDARHRLREKSEFACQFKLIWVVQSRSKKYSALPIGQIIFRSLARPASLRGAYALSSRNVECGMRWTRCVHKTNAPVADGEVVAS
jgi:hypothetical protein